MKKFLLLKPFLYSSNSLFPKYFLILLLSYLPLWANSQKPAINLSHQEQTWVHQSYQEETQGNYEKAFQIMQKVLKSNPKDYFTQQRIGYLLTLQKKFREATPYHQTAAQLRPESLEPWLSLSVIDLNLQNYTQLLQTSRQILKMDPNNYLGYLREIQALIQLKSFLEALQQIDLATQKYPTDIFFLEQRATAQMALARSSAAQMTLKQILMLQPENTYAHVLLESVQH